jgi:hypothetical protein
MKMPHIKNCLVVPSLFQYLVVINSVSFSCKRLGFFSTKWGWGEIHVDLKKTLWLSGTTEVCNRWMDDAPEFVIALVASDIDGQQV